MICPYSSCGTIPSTPPGQRKQWRFPTHVLLTANTTYMAKRSSSRWQPRWTSSRHSYTCWSVQMDTASIGWTAAEIPVCPVFQRRRACYQPTQWRPSGENENRLWFCMYENQTLRVAKWLEQFQSHQPRKNHNRVLRQRRGGQARDLEGWPCSPIHRRLQGNRNETIKIVSSMKPTVTPDNQNAANNHQQRPLTLSDRHVSKLTSYFVDF